VLGPDAPSVTTRAVGGRVLRSCTSAGRRQILGIDPCPFFSGQVEATLLIGLRGPATLRSPVRRGIPGPRSPP